MKIEFIFRIIGLLTFAFVGAYYGIQLAELLGYNVILGGVVLGVVGAVLGYLIAPYLTTRPAHYLRTSISKLSIPTLLVGLIGLIVGLIVAALAAFPLSLLPSPFGDLLPFLSVLVFGYFGVILFVVRQNDILSGWRAIFPGHSHDRGKEADQGEQAQPAAEPELGGRVILLDTSVIIDGRIADIAHTGFLTGSLLIPRFVLNELQYIADSADSLRRQRGRRGMEVLSQLQKDPHIEVRISDIDVEGMREVDDKLVVLARQLRCPILTNDYNLNRVAELQGVKILNVNELANAVKSVLLPGEIFSINIIQEGREVGQGVAYLDDGTMVVVEDGRDQIGKQVDVIVTKVLQTAAGRMIFARLGTNG
jgi:uncharacterized protein YacL